MFSIWKSLYEPKYYDRSYFVVYSLFVVAGLLLLATSRDPLIVHTELGISILIGLFFTIGGAVALSSLSKGIWYKERSGIYFILGGLFGELIGTILDPDSAYERVYYSIFITVIIILVLIRRYRIKDYFLDPTKG